jgi:hypothetical protein
MAMIAAIGVAPKAAAFGASGMIMRTSYGQRGPRP